MDARKQTVEIVDIYFLSGLFLWVTTRPGRGRVVTDDLLKEMMSFESDKLSKDILKKLKASITYFQNQKHRMDYHFYREHNFPIGSGATEAACKTLVKQRLCQSGMKWEDKGARLILVLRALVCTPSRFEQFWDRINAVGLSGISNIH